MATGYRYEPFNLPHSAVPLAPPASRSPPPSPPSPLAVATSSSSSGSNERTSRGRSGTFQPAAGEVLISVCGRNFAEGNRRLIKRVERAKRASSQTRYQARFQARRTRCSRAIALVSAYALARPPLPIRGQSRSDRGEPRGRRKFGRLTSIIPPAPLPLDCAPPSFLFFGPASKRVPSDFD